ACGGRILNGGASPGASTSGTSRSRTQVSIACRKKAASGSLQGSLIRPDRRLPAVRHFMFIELHTRSAFSFLSSGSLPEEYAAGAAEYGMPAIALLDRDTVAGVVRFHSTARDAGVKSIVGAEITMEDGSLLPLIPLNLAGYQNLCRLITTIKLRAKKGEHAATREDIEEHSQNLL